MPPTALARGATPAARAALCAPRITRVTAARAHAWCGRCSRCSVRVAERSSSTSSSANSARRTRAGAAAAAAAATATPGQFVCSLLASVRPLVVTFFAAVAIVLALNAVRGVIRKAWLAALHKTGPGSLLVSLLGTALHIIGVDVTAVATSGGAAAPALPAPSPAAAPAKAAAAPAAGSDSDSDSAAPQLTRPRNMAAHLAARTERVQALFPGALSADDFIGRAEAALCAYGFLGDNTLALTNLCRDESTALLKSKIDAVFGHSFNVNGLGGVLTCGKTGLAAGLSHAPICAGGRERYAFFAFPHIGVNEAGRPQAIYRPGRRDESSACGALVYCLNAVQTQGIESCKTEPGFHKPTEPEGSILASRLARRMEAENTNVTSLDLVGITNLAQRTITSDLEKLIENGVDPKKADYAVITGVQIHSWPNPETGAPALEFVAPASGYVVVNGVRRELELERAPALTPRQAAILAVRSMGADATQQNGAGAVPMAYVNKKLLTGVNL